MSQFSSFFNNDRIAKILSPAGRRRFDPKTINANVFMQNHSVEDATELLRTVTEMKNEQMIGSAIGMITRMINEDPSRNLGFAEEGLVSILDQLLGLKWNDKRVCTLVVELVYQIIQEPAGDRLSQRRRSGGVVDTLLAVRSASVDESSSSSKANTPTQKIRSYFFGSGTIFRIVKLAQSSLDDERRLTSLLNTLILFSSISAITAKLVSCGSCDLITQIMKNYDSNAWNIMALTCGFLHQLVVMDLDYFGGKYGVQDKLGDGSACESLSAKIVLALRTLSTSNSKNAQSEISTQSFTLILLTWPLKALGSLARWHERNKDRLFAAAVYFVFTACPSSQILNEAIVESAAFAESLCWCLANISYPHRALQDALGAAEVIPLLLFIFGAQGDEPLVIQEACRALRNCIHMHGKNLRQAVKCRVFNSAQRLFTACEEQPEVLQWVMFALASLVTDPGDDIEDEAKADECLKEQELIDETIQNSPELTVPSTDKKWEELLEELGLVSRIVLVLQRYFKNADIVQWTALVLSLVGQRPVLAEQLAAMNCCEALLHALNSHWENEDVLEEVLHAIGNLSLYSPACRALFLKKSNLIPELFMRIAKLHANSESVIEQLLHCLCGLCPVAVERFTSVGTHDPAKVPPFFCGQSIDADVFFIRSLPLFSQYAQFLRSFGFGHGTASSSTAAVLPTPQSSNNANNALIAGMKGLIAASMKFAKTNDCIAEFLAQFLASWTCVAVAQQFEFEQLPKDRLFSGYRLGYLSQAYKKFEGRDSTGEAMMLDLLCNTQSIQVSAQLVSLFVQYSTTTTDASGNDLAANDRLLTWCLLGLLQCSSTYYYIPSLSPKYLSALCRSLATVTTRYQYQGSSSIVPLALANLLQLCREPSLRIKISELLLEGGGNGPFLLTAVAHQLQRRDAVRLGMEILGVLSNGPFKDALSYIAAMSRYGSGSNTEEASNDVDEVGQVSEQATVVEETTNNQSGTEESGAGKGNMFSRMFRSRSSTTTSTNEAVVSRYRTNTVSSFFNLSLNLAALTSRTRSSTAIALPSEEVIMPPFSLLDSMVWESLPARGTWNRNLALAANKIVSTGLSDMEAQYNNARSEPSTPIYESGYLGGNNEGTVAQQMLPVVQSLLHILLPSCSRNEDRLTLIAVMDGLHAFLLDSTSRGLLSEDAELMRIVVTILRYQSLMHEDRTQSLKEEESGMKVENEEGKQDANVSAKEEVEEGWQQFSGPDNVQHNLEYEKHSRITLIALCLHVLSTSCLPLSSNPSERDLTRRQGHLTRLVFELDLHNLSLEILQAWATVPVIVEAVLRLLHFSIKGVEIQERFMSLTVPLVIAAKSEDVVDRVVTSPQQQSLQALTTALIRYTVPTTSSPSSSSTSSRVAYYALLALASAADHVEQACTILQQCGLIPTALSLFAQHATQSMDLIIASCRLIVATPSLNAAWGAAGACRLVVTQALPLYPNSALIAELACRAIGSLAEYDKNKQLLDDHGVCQVVTSALCVAAPGETVFTVIFGDSSNSNANSSGDNRSKATGGDVSGVAQWGCTAIYHLARGRDGEAFQLKLVAAGAAEAVARALVKFHETESVAAACCRALVVLLIHHELARSKLGASFGVCGCVIEVLQSHPSSLTVALWGCRAVAVLSERHEANIMRLGSAGGCETVAVTLQSHPASEGVAAAGCDCISFMCETLSNGFAERFGQSGACEAVVSVLRRHTNSSAMVTARSAIALASLARVPGNSSWFGPAGACEALVAAFIPHMKEAEVVKYLALAVANLCTAVENNKERLGALGICSLLGEALGLHYTESETARALGLAILRLCESIDVVKVTRVASPLPTGGPDATQVLLWSTSEQIFAEAVVVDSNNLGLGDRKPSSKDNLAQEVFNTPQSVEESLAIYYTAIGCANRGKFLTLPLVYSSLVAGLKHNVGDVHTAQTLSRAIFVLCHTPFALDQAGTVSKGAVSSSTSSYAHYAQILGKVERLKMWRFHAVEEVSRAMSWHDTAEDIQRWGCLALATLCRDTPANQKVCRDETKQSVAGMVISALRTHRGAGVSSTSPACVEAALTAIRCLCRDYIDPYADLLPPSAAEEIGIVMSSGEVARDLQSRFGEAHACEALLEVFELHARQPEVISLASPALFHVTDGHAANRRTLCFSGAAELVLAALQRYSSSSTPSNSVALAATSNSPIDEVLECLLGVLLGLCFNPVGRARCVNNNLPRWLFTTALPSRLGLNKASANDEAALMLLLAQTSGTLGSGATVFAMVGWDEYSYYIACLCCALSAALCYRSPSNQDKCIAVGAVKALTALLLRAAVIHQTLQQRGTVSPASRSAPLSPLPSSSTGNVVDTSLDSNETSTHSSTSSTPTTGCIAPEDCTVTMFLWPQVDLVQESCRALFHLLGGDGSSNQGYSTHGGSQNFEETMRSNNEDAKAKVIAAGTVDVLTALLVSGSLSPVDESQVAGGGMHWARKLMDLLEGGGGAASGRNVNDL